MAGAACLNCVGNQLVLLQVGTLNYMSPEAILGGSNNIRGAPPMKVRHYSIMLPISFVKLSCQRFASCKVHHDVSFWLHPTAVLSIVPLPARAHSLESVLYDRMVSQMMAEPL